MMPISDEELSAFRLKAATNTYPVGKPIEKKSERKDFEEITFEDGDLYYRDSFVAGSTKSAGTELIRYNGKPIWYSNYGGGIVESEEVMGREAISFLKKAFLTRDEDPKFKSFRGPRLLIDGDWEYKYNQKGNINEFEGYEEIKFKGKLIFYHRIFGGRIK